MRLTENCVKGHALSVVVSETESSWRPVTNRVPWGSILGPALLDFFISGLEDEAECTCSEFADDTSFGRVTDRPDSCATALSSLDRLEKLAQEACGPQQGEMQSPAFLVRSSPTQQCMLGHT